MAEFNAAMGIPYFETDLSMFYGVSPRQGYAILGQKAQEEDRRLHNNPSKLETRGRKPLLTPKQINQADSFLRDAGWDARVLTWAQLASELEFDVSGDTMKRAMGSLDYHKCIACSKGWVSAQSAQKRREFAETMLVLKPTPADWLDVRFSDEVHWRVGPQGKMRIIRRPGERYCGDCIQEQLNRDDEKEWEAAHSWAAIGYEFKSELSFYNVPGNRNGKLMLRVYREEILELLVRPWLDRGDRFILEEDNDSGHGGGSSNNIVARWKQKHGLDYYFNCASSPDLSPIENCWQPPKQYLKKYPHWDEFETRELAYEGWQK